MLLEVGAEWVMHTSWSLKLQFINIIFSIVIKQ